MNANELRNKSVEELHAECEAKQAELFNLRIQRGVGQSPQTHLFGKAKTQIARIKTILREKQGNNHEY